MEISVQKMSALVIILGSVLFLIAAFSPISGVFAEPSPAGKLEIIMASPNAWSVAQIFFALGAMITVIGIALIGDRFRTQSVAWFIHASVAVLCLGVRTRAGEGQIDEHDRAIPTTPARSQCARLPNPPPCCMLSLEHRF